MPSVNPSRQDSSCRVCCVVRTVGERTTDACRAWLGQSVDGVEHVVSVGHNPFPDTLADSLRAGLAARKPWTLCVDADVLPFMGAVDALLAEADSLPESVLELQPVVFDRFFGGWRPAGVHLYRTRHLGETLRALEGMPASIRPETALLTHMAGTGLTWKQSSLEFGVHDFGQSASDVYRKCFVHARKHGVLAPRLGSYWRARAGTADFAVALAGLEAGLRYTGPIDLDREAACFKAAGAMQLEACHSERLHEEMDPAALLEAEEAIIAALPLGIAPVWDWIDTVWAAEGECRKTVDAFVGAMAQAAAGPCLVDHPDARTRVFVRAAREWGLPVMGVVGDRSGCRSVGAIPVVSEKDAETSALTRVRRAGDGRFLMRTADRTVIEPLAADLRPSGSKTSRDEAIATLVRRLSERRVTRVLVYGAGDVGVAFAAAMGPDCVVSAFVESHPGQVPEPPGGAPVLDPERALTIYERPDVVIASMHSARAMIRRLLIAAAATNRWPCRIWCLETP